MDRQLKARLIGAAVLVTLVVLLVPELLTGPKPSQPAPAREGERSTRSVTIDLSGRAGSAAEPVADRAPASSPVADQTVEKEKEQPSAPVVTMRAAAQPQPATTSAVVARPEPAPAAPASAPPAAQPEPEVEENASPIRGGWSVQVGAFSASSSALKLVRDLESEGYRAFVSPVKRSGKELHRVRVGPEPDRPAAERLAAKLKERGLPAAVVAND